jgi:hypothetical protein
MSANVGDEFKPGEKVPQSGIYDVIHDRMHHAKHQVTCVHADTFPPYNHCSHHVRFRLASPAIHANNHDEFK